MSENENAQIDNSLSDDVGDEISNRFRYQWILSAITCCMLLDQYEDVQEVFCEHHEDILIKHLNGLFTGIQIKTKAIDQPVWKSSDVAVVRAFARFVLLDNKYQNQFRAFIFGTNHPLHSLENGLDITFLLKEILKCSDYTQLNNTVKKFVKRISMEAGIVEEHSFISLKKVSINNSFPKLQDATMRLIDTVSSVWDKAENVSYEGIRRASINLIDACTHASSLANKDFLPAYLAISSNSVEKEIQERIAEKTFSKERVYEILTQGLDEKIPLSCDPMNFESLRTGNTELLRKKLTAGGFSANSTMYAESLRDTAEYAGTLLIQKYGYEPGLEKYYELRLKVQGEAAKEFEKNKRDNEKFGLNMQSSLQDNLKTRVSSGENFFGCSTYHLEGLAYLLTSQCKIVWSSDRPWEVE